MFTPPPRRRSSQQLDPAVAGGLLDLVLSANQVGTWQLDPASGQVHWDSRMFELFGVSALGSDAHQVWREAVPAEERAEIEALVAQLIADGEGEIAVHYKARWPDGSVRTIAGQTRMVREASGAVHVLGANWDVTDDREIRARLEEHQHLLEAALERASMGAMVWCPETNDLQYTEGVFHLYGVTPTGDRDLDHARVRATVNPDDLAAVRRQVEQSARELSPTSVRFRARRASDGADRHIHLSALGFASTGERKVVGIIRDITDEVEANTRVSDATAHYRALSDAIPDMLILVRGDGFVIDFKPAVGSLAERSTFLHQRLTEASPAPGPITERFLATAQRVIASGEPTQMVFEADFPRWRAGAFEARFVRCSDDTALVVVRDVTEQQRAAVAHEQARVAAEEAVRAKSAFLATVSHEMRTPLSGVIGTADALAATTLSPEQRAQVAAIHTSGEMLLSLVDDLLDLARIEAGGLRVEALPFDPEAVLDDVTAVLGGMAAERGLELRHQRSGLRVTNARGDARRFRQVVLNLVGNALKFTERGHVTLALDLAVREPAPAEAIPAGETPLLLHLSVTDTGIGIAPERQAAIFAPFVQLDSGTARRRGGAGLGLAISRSLVGLMGGALQVKSRLGHGSQFTVSLPLTAKLDLPTPTLSSTPTRERLRVLLVEDNDVIQAITLGILHGLRVRQVVTVGDGQAAVDQALREPFDLILMDLQLPGLDGYQATRTIRASAGPSQYARIVAITAHLFDDDRRQCEEAGMDGFLTKPLQRAELAPWIHEASAREG